MMPKQMEARNKLICIFSSQNSIVDDVLAILGSNYSASDVDYYINSTYSTRDYLPEFIQQSEAFQAGMPDCISSSRWRWGKGYDEL
jgi:hypothetical protein